MRPFSAIVAAFLMACAASATGRADTPPAVAAAAAQPPAPGCGCPLRVHRHVWRRHVRYHARYRRHWRVAVATVAYWPAIPAYYNPLLPTPDDSAYDRAMTLHFRSAAVTGIQIAEPGYPPTPPVRGIYPYRYPAGPAVFQYDGITGQYIALSQYDARRVFPAVPVPLVAR
jgi:hypothetical protein